MSNIIQTLEAERMTRTLPEFKPGDTVVVQIKVVEGDRERVQAYEGVVIARSNRGFNSSFTVRKISHGEGVERTAEFVVHQRHLQSERDRFGMDAVRAPDHGNVFVFLRLLRDNGAQLRDIVDKNVHRLHQLHGQGGVDHVG